MVANGLSGKTILITGSTDGLGRLVAKHVAALDATVLIHGRNESKGKAVVREISAETGNSHLTYFNGDFASLDGVAHLADHGIA